MSLSPVSPSRAALATFRSPKSPGTPIGSPGTPTTPKQQSQGVLTSHNSNLSPYVDAISLASPEATRTLRTPGSGPGSGPGSEKRKRKYDGGAGPSETRAYSETSSDSGEAASSSGASSYGSSIGTAPAPVSEGPAFHTPEKAEWIKLFSKLANQDQEIEHPAKRFKPIRDEQITRIYQKDIREIPPTSINKQPLDDIARELGKKLVQLDELYTAIKPVDTNTIPTQLPVPKQQQKTRKKLEKITPQVEQLNQKLITIQAQHPELEETLALLGLTIDVSSLPTLIETLKQDPESLTSDIELYRLLHNLAQQLKHLNDRLSENQTLFNKTCFIIGANKNTAQLHYSVSGNRTKWQSFEPLLQAIASSKGVTISALNEDSAETRTSTFISELRLLRHLKSQLNEKKKQLTTSPSNESLQTQCSDLENALLKRMRYYNKARDFFFSSRLNLAKETINALKTNLGLDTSYDFKETKEDITTEINSILDQNPSFKGMLTESDVFSPEELEQHKEFKDLAFYLLVRFIALLNSQCAENHIPLDNSLAFECYAYETKDSQYTQQQLFPPERRPTSAHVASWCACPTCAPRALVCEQVQDDKNIKQDLQLKTLLMEGSTSLNPRATLSFSPELI